MKNRIQIEGIQLYAYHGCLEEESRIGGHYTVDVYIETDFMEAAIKDDLEKTIDYCSIYEICKTEMAIRSKLIEQVCHRIFTGIFKAHPRIQALRVKITKHAPPMNGDVDKACVEIES
ncbi:MAG TPA: dihydroneopterin aldolase [Bacteroidia bacterium]|nr:dihydroneopterin aldolase [Bacteroidia bacterium]